MYNGRKLNIKKKKNGASHAQSKSRRKKKDDKKRKAEEGKTVEDASLPLTKEEKRVRESNWNGKKKKELQE